MADSTTKPKASSDRRTFLKIGAGVVAGAAIASVVEIPYYSSVIGGNNNSSSTAVSSLKDELSSTQSQLSNTQNSLNATQSSLTQAQGTISSLNSQLTATQGSLSSANSQLSNAQSSLTAANSQNASIAQQLTATQGSLSSANAAISTLKTQVSSANSQVTSLQSQASTLQITIDTTTGFIALDNREQPIVEAIASCIIPTDSNGPGAKTAGSVYFIDRALASDYGRNGNMYTEGPFIPANLTTAVTVNDTTYSAGTAAAPTTAGYRWQYSISARDFWRFGLQALETYSNGAYGGNFETLSAANQVACLTDLYNNKPTSFNGILPQDFFYEVFFLSYAGFLSDPLYGGNRGMVGWLLTGFNGVNFGDFYGEGHTSAQLMVATTPTRLMPASLAQLQKGSP